MFSFLKIVLLIGAFIHISSSSVLRRHDLRSSYHHGDGHTKAASNAATSAIGLVVPTSTAILPPALSTDADPLPTESSNTSSDSNSDNGDASDDSCDADGSDESDNSGGSDGSDEPEGSYTQPLEPSSTLSTISVIPQPATKTESAVGTQVPTVTASTSVTPATTQSAGALWEPAVGSTWQIELSGVVTDTTYPADVFDLDLFDTPQSTIDAIHAAGKKLICYFSAGSFENWRPDQASFQADDKGSAMEGWDGEWWLNIKSANVRSIMATRIALAASKGCDGVDPDNVDGYANGNGLGLTASDAVDYLNFLADTAHAKGISIGLKNAADLVESALPKMQWHVNEQCLEYDECNLFQPFIDAGKPVFHIEYPEDAPHISTEVKSEKCDVPSTSGFSTVLKTTALNAWIEPC